MATVLLVEDDPDDADLMRLAFRRHSGAHDLVVAGDGEEAFDYLHGAGRFVGEAPGRPVVVLLDLKLRGGSGIAVLRRLRATAGTATLPVVLMTSSAEPRDVLDGYEAGANAYVQKPDTFEALTEVVDATVRFWTCCNELPGRSLSRECR